MLYLLYVCFEMRFMSALMSKRSCNRYNKRKALDMIVQEEERSYTTYYNFSHNYFPLQIFPTTIHSSK